MKIAVASQNRKIVTGHAGKCRRFWIYDIDAGAVKDRRLLELPREQSFHEHQGAELHPLQGVQVLITGGMGEGLARRLSGMGIEGLVTTETDPDRAVTAYLAGALPLGQPGVHGGHDH
ncbi:MAG: NifB/NifX family molybdenum-iron cluster-binding protein [Gammaproteobacteria bacterium]|nr:NifB/NifX family molybdenum-iron cluster-binding protein [Gammaproteobacteria bacterium]